MREILFRGRGEEGDWIVGDYVYLKDEYSQFKHCIYCSQQSEFFEVDPATVGQYTGLKDKNGKKIFEGDEFLLHRDKGNKLTVVWNDEHSSFLLKSSKYPNLSPKNYSLSFYSSKIEIIGNVHEGLKHE